MVLFIRDRPNADRTRKRLESTDERKHVAEAKKDGWLVHKLISLTANGWPDRSYRKAGLEVLIEWKPPGPPHKRKLRPSQVERHAELRRAGFRPYVAQTIEEAREILRKEWERHVDASGL